MTRRSRMGAAPVAVACIVAACAVQSCRSDGCQGFWPAVIVEHGPRPEYDLDVAKTWKVVDRFPSGMTHEPSEDSVFDPDWVMFHVHQPPGVLLMKLHPWLSELVWRNLPAPGKSGAFCTGDRGFDRLNRTVGIRRISTYDSDIFKNNFMISFDPEVDAEEASSKYESLDGVVYAEPDGYLRLEDRRTGVRLPTDPTLDEVRRFLEADRSR